MTKSVQIRTPSFVLLIVVTLIAGCAFGGWMLASLSDVGTDAHGGVVFTPPASIDNTGQTDVSDALNYWIATQTADGTAEDPSVIALSGTYRVEYGLTIGSKRNDVANPGLPVYTRNHVVLDLTHATLLQADSTTYKQNGVVVQPRKRWGVPIIRLLGDTDVTVLGGTLESTDTLGKYSAAREPWAGVSIASGTDGVTLQGLHIEQVWGDFVDIAGDPWPTNVLIDGGDFERNGRQGVTFNDVNHLEVRNVYFFNVERILFDHEPIASGGATDVYIHDNTGTTGGLGYMQLRPGATTPLSDIRVVNNHLSAGHLHVYASAGPSHDARVGFTFTGNTTDTTLDYTGGYLGRSPLIFVPGDWSQVTITDNHDLGTPRATAIALSANDTDVVTAPNAFVGFKPPA